MHDIFDLSNYYNKVIHILGFIVRFLSNFKKEEKEGVLDVKNLNRVEIFLFKRVQRKLFKKEIISLEK